MSFASRDADTFSPPVRLRRTGGARTTQVLILAFGLSAGFLAGTGYALAVGALDISAPALRCALSLER